MVHIGNRDELLTYCGVRAIAPLNILSHNLIVYFIGVLELLRHCDLPALYTIKQPYNEYIGHSLDWAIYHLGYRVYALGIWDNIIL